MSEEAVQDQSGATGDTGGASGDAGVQDAGGTQKPASWVDGLGDDLKGNEVLKAYKDPAELAKAHVEILGKVPQVPETPDAYKGQITFPEDFPGDENFEAMTRVWAKEAGLSAEQYKTFGSKYVEAQAGMIKEMILQEQKAWDAYRLECGSSFDENLDLAQRAARMFGAPETAERVKARNIDTESVKFLVRIGKAISEDSAFEDRLSRDVKTREYTASGTPMLDYPSMKKK